VFAYIVRRLLWAVILLIVLSMVTFAIFYLVPRLGGATPETLAARYVGRAATAETVHLTAEKLGLLDPVPVQYWHWLKGIFVGASYDYGSGVEHCPAPCLGYSFITKQPVWPELLEALRDAGWRNYSLFLRDDGLLIGYAETDDLAAAQEQVARTEVNARWQAAMSELFQSEGAPDEAWELIPEVFNLEDQLRSARADS